MEIKKIPDKEIKLTIKLANNDKNKGDMDKFNKKNKLWLE